MKTQISWIVCSQDSSNSGIFGNLELVRTGLLRGLIAKQYQSLSWLHVQALKVIQSFGMGSRISGSNEHIGSIYEPTIFSDRFRCRNRL